METRRSFLKFAAMLSGAGAASVIPESIQRAYAIEPPPGTTFLDAEHIVILMQENRSFDHALGTLRGVRGFNDPRALRLGNGNSVFVQTDASGKSYAPWRLDIRDTRITWMGSIPHSRDSQVDAWNGGQHDKWLDAKRSHHKEYAHIPITMGHYTREDLPFYYALADAFTVCDQHYCGAMTSTTPNRCLLWTGTVREQQRASSRAFMRNEEIEGGGMTWKTFPERLTDAGITWKFYQNELTNAGGLSEEQEAWLGNFGCNPLEYFAAYHVEAYPGSVQVYQERRASLAKHAAELEQKLAREHDPEIAADLRVQLHWNRRERDLVEAGLRQGGKAGYKRLNRLQRTLHDSAFTTNSADPHYHSLEELSFEESGRKQTMMLPKGDILYQFRKDVNEGKLPTVSWLTAPEKFSDHPTSPWYGAWYVSEVMDILTKNPELWKRTIFILTYDENDGYFDHAPSFVAPDPTRPETGRTSQGIDISLEYTYAEDELRQGVASKYARSGPIGLGFRVPLIVASPWSRGGWVNSQLFEHTSVLMFLEHFVRHKFRRNVREENISAWRRTISGDLTSIFRTFDPQEAALDFLDRDRFVMSIQQARNKPVPSNFRELTAEQIGNINNNLLTSDFTAHQEPGIRRACALPYELYVDGSLTLHGDAFELRMKAGDQVHGKRSAGAPFNVYLRNLATQNASQSNMRAATFSVKAGNTLREKFPLSLFAGDRYEIDVHGPNGFYRLFTGSKSGSALQTELRYEQTGSSLTGNVAFHLKNTGGENLTVQIEDMSYKQGTRSKMLAAGEQTSLVLELKRSHGWYDFVVKANEIAGEARFAGHVETGRASFTDPLMGRAEIT